MSGITLVFSNPVQMHFADMAKSYCAAGERKPWVYEVARWFPGKYPRKS